MAHWPRALVFGFLFAAASYSQDAPKPAPSALDKTTMETYLRHLNLWSPQVKVQIDDPVPSPTLPDFYDVHIKATLGDRSGEITYLVSKDGRKILQANVFDIGWNPFREDLAKLKTEGQPSLGTPGSTVVLVLFSDFQCSFCKQQAEVLRAHLVKEYPKQVRLYFKDFPLEPIHPWAKPAAIASRCVFQQKPTAFWDIHDFLFGKQAEITAENLKATVLEFGSSKGLDGVRLSACVDSKATLPEVERNIAEGKTLSVNATPTMFVNGRRLPSMTDWPSLKMIIDNELEYQKTAKNAGEDCGCDLSLPAAPKLPNASLSPANK